MVLMNNPASQEYQEPQQRCSLGDFVSGTIRRFNISPEEYQRIVNSMRIYEEGDVWAHLINEARAERLDATNPRLSDEIVGTLNYIGYNMMGIGEKDDEDMNCPGTFIEQAREKRIERKAKRLAYRAEARRISQRLCSVSLDDDGTEGMEHEARNNKSLGPSMKDSALVCDDRYF